MSFVCLEFVSRGRGWPAVVMRYTPQSIRLQQHTDVYASWIAVAHVNASAAARFFIVSFVQQESQQAAKTLNCLRWSPSSWFLKARTLCCSRVLRLRLRGLEDRPSFSNSTPTPSTYQTDKIDSEIGSCHWAESVQGRSEALSAVLFVYFVQRNTNSSLVHFRNHVGNLSWKRAAA